MSGSALDLKYLDPISPVLNLHALLCDQSAQTSCCVCVENGCKSVLEGVEESGEPIEGQIRRQRIRRIERWRGRIGPASALL